MKAAFIFVVAALVASSAGAQGFIQGRSPGSFTDEAPTTALSTLVASMDVGDFAVLSTTDYVTTFGVGASSGNILPFGTTLIWNAATRTAFFDGSDHIFGAPYIGTLASYDELSNTWSSAPHEVDYVYHNYDHIVFDTSRNKFYRGQLSSRVILQYDLGTETWSTFTTIPVETLSAVTPARGMALFPERDSLVVFSGNQLVEYNLTSETWSVLGTAANHYSDTYHTFAQYSPTHQMVLFGGGNRFSTPAQNAAAIYKLDASGTITALADAPIEINIGGYNSVPVVTDSVTGDFILYGPDNVLRAYNGTTGVWTTPTVSGNPTRGASDTFVGGAISTYGVIMWLSMTGSSTGTVWIYKHAE